MSDGRAEEAGDRLGASWGVPGPMTRKKVRGNMDRAEYGTSPTHLLFQDSGQDTLGQDAAQTKNDGYLELMKVMISMKGSY